MNLGPDALDSGETWINIFIDEPVFASSISLYMIFAPGVVSSIKSAKFDPSLSQGKSEKKWIEVYNKDSPRPLMTNCVSEDTSDGKRCPSKVVYDLWMQNFQTNEFRIEFKFEGYSWVSVDAVRIQGRKTMMHLLTHDDQGRIYFKPNEYFVGKTFFDYYVEDLKYFKTWGDLQSTDATRFGRMEIDVTPINTAPLIKNSYIKGKVEILPEG